MTIKMCKMHNNPATLHGCLNCPFIVEFGHRLQLLDTLTKFNPTIYLSDIPKGCLKKISSFVTSAKKGGGGIGKIPNFIDNQFGTLLDMRGEGLNVHVPNLI